MKKIHLALLFVVMLICFGVFFYQMNNNLETMIVFNETEIAENGTAIGFLMDSFGRGIANKTITFHQPGNGTVSVVTDENGTFYIENLQNLPELGGDNYYGEFTFKGDSKYKGTTYGYNLTVIPA